MRKWSARLATRTHPTVFSAVATAARAERSTRPSGARRPCFSPPSSSSTRALEGENPPGLRLVPPFSVGKDPLACEDASFDRLLVQNHFPCRRRHSNPNLFSPLVSTSTSTPIRAARRGFICRAADYRLQLIFPASSPSVRSSPVRLFWMWNEAMASDGGSSSFRELYGNIHTPAVLTGAAFALVALLLSLWLILQHLRSYSDPAEQKWIIAVLFMVPVYASESIISLWNSKFSLACDILRNCYEAFALYAFGRYLVACLGGERQVFRLLENRKREELTEQLLDGQDKAQAQNQSRVRNFFCDPNALGENLYTIIKFGLVQYMILKTLCAFLALILEPFGAYGDGEFKWNYGYPYIAVIINFSQTWALYCLVKFYNATHEKLHAIRPLAKFISFKAIVFATWWQGVGIAIICQTGLLPKEGKVQNAIQDFLICIEVVKDVALTISQAIGPVEKGVEKGVGKIQEKFHHISLKPGDKKEPEVDVEEHITENVVDGKPVTVDADVEVEQKVQDDNEDGKTAVIETEVEIQQTER
ncbi:protein LAZ1 homolog 2-like isoform X5 [Panicum virgatum]|uniref:protein LAZ1 homolog 2-like isoform X5 n=1 Tax=Panicum virgatum TaxID=38727 RepID=UPI0019D6626C|nr:protein LAZ1 homolog 2-like isoform X5 [Panicum virgatum]